MDVRATQWWMKETRSWWLSPLKWFPASNVPCDLLHTVQSVVEDIMKKLLHLTQNCSQAILVVVKIDQAVILKGTHR